MINKKVLRPDRLRQVPPQFSWIDQRLVRENFLRQGSHAAWALYLVLVTVADAQGLSYYSESTLSRLLQLEAGQLSTCRQELVVADLVAYQKPLYQVLALPEPASVVSEGHQVRTGQALSLGDILRRATEGGGL